MQDKRGGVFMVVVKSRELVMEKQDTNDSDILEVIVQWQG